MLISSSFFTNFSLVVLIKLVLIYKRCTWLKMIGTIFFNRKGVHDWKWLPRYSSTMCITSFTIPLIPTSTRCDEVEIYEICLIRGKSQPADLLHSPSLYVLLLSSKFTGTRSWEFGKYSTKSITKEVCIFCSEICSG